jgi:hypothetical protein
MEKRKAIYFRKEYDNEIIIGKVFSIWQNKNPELLQRQLRLAVERYFQGFHGRMKIQTGNIQEFSGIFRNFQENKISVWITTHFNK